MIKELENKVNLLELARSDYPNRIKKAGTGTYRISPCPVCNSDSKKHFNINSNGNYYNSFADCCTGGSVYKYLTEVRNLGEDEAFNELKRLAGGNMIKKEHKNSFKPTADQSQNDLKQINNFKTIVNTLYTNEINLKDNYFIQRGLNVDTIRKFMLSIDENKNNAVIPYFEDHEVIGYNSRPLDKQGIYYKAKGMKDRFFNIDVMEEDKDIIILTEGEFDTMTLDQMGYASVSLGGVGNIENFKEKIKDKHDDKVIFTMLDNDEAGIKASKKSGYKNISIPSKYKDINEWYLEDPKAIDKHINKELENLKRPNSATSYITNKLISDLEAYKEFKDKKSGFKNLDKITNMYPGLYVMGGISTLGKTTFIHQLTDQMAEMNEHILFFSLEMSTLELVTKSLARYTNKHTESPVSATNIRLDNMGISQRRALNEAVKRYSSDTGKRYNIIEGTTDTNVLTIRRDIENYIKLNNVKPVVVIDYLQIINGTDKFQGDKQRIDFIVSELKRISRDNNIILIVISSFNRTNYMLPIGFESFKESGGIEYTADVVWGIQLSAIHDDIFNSDAKIKEKRRIIDRAKKENPRRIELVALKNRNGISNYSCFFEYEPHKDLFTAVTESQLQVKVL